MIENIQLGESISVYDSLRLKFNIESKTFCTKKYFSEEDDVESNSVSFPVTENFNFSQYRNSTQKQNHFGLLHPVVISGTDKLFSLVVLLVHTEIPSLITTNYDGELPEDLLNFKQLVASDVIKEIEEMYTSKYGNPTFEISILLDFFVIKGRDVVNYAQPEGWKGTKVSWETKYFTVSLFKGFEMPAAKYNKFEKRYITSARSEERINIDYENGDIECTTFPYIIYTLNKEAIEKLNLDKKNI